jgi:hypothetical protein
MYIFPPTPIISIYLFEILMLIVSTALDYRLRRDGRRSVEDNDRIRQSLHAPDPKINIRNPTRVVPEVAGMISPILLHEINMGTN